MEKLNNKVLVILFCVFIFTINILNMLIPDRAFSETENRFLAEVPRFNIKSLLSGEFTSDFETYVSDQFIFKDYWVALKSDVERLSLKKENNGVFFGRDGYLLEDFKEPGERINNNLQQINYFINKLPNISIYLLLVPNSVKIYEDKLPLFAQCYDQLKIIEKAKDSLDEEGIFIDVYENLNNKKDQYIYFKTDHHWTMRGAYYGYKKYCNVIGITPYDFDNYIVEEVDNNFYGTFYSKTSNRYIEADKIELFEPKVNISYEVKYSDKEAVSDTLYELKHLDKRDKYSMFLDGNHPLLKIKSSVNNNKRIVIFKDSYANVFIPFLVNHYEEIHVIDLRYYKLNPYEYIEENNINEALFLYNVSTFSKETNLSWLKR